MDTTMDPPTHPTPPGLLTEVEVTSLVLGLEEAPPGLSMDVGSLGHEELHIMFAAALNGDVEGSLTWGGGGRTITLGSCRAKTQPSLKGVGCSVQIMAGGGAARQSLGWLLLRTAMDLQTIISRCGISDAGSPRYASKILGSKGVRLTCRIPDVRTFQTHKRL